MPISWGFAALLASQSLLLVCSGHIWKERRGILTKSSPLICAGPLASATVASLLWTDKKGDPHKSNPWGFAGPLASQSLLQVYSGQFFKGKMCDSHKCMHASKLPSMRGFSSAAARGERCFALHGMDELNRN
eukprot:1160447-Pelagomonas_calceolata.AAC.8